MPNRARSGWRRFLGLRGSATWLEASLRLLRALQERALRARERIAAPAVAREKPALGIHPEHVARMFRRRGRASFHLENRAPASPFGDQPVAFEHLAHRADGRRRFESVFGRQDLPDLLRPQVERSRFSVQIRRSISSEVRQVMDFGARLRSSKALIPPSADALPTCGPSCG